MPSSSPQSGSGKSKRASSSAAAGPNRPTIPFKEDEGDPNLSEPIKHPFVVITAKSRPGERTVKIAMPDEHHKMVTGAVTTVGNTIVLGSYPESSGVWAAVHDPARADAYVVLRVIALVDEANMYETTVKRLEYSRVAGSGGASAAWADADPRGLLTRAPGAKVCSLVCPVPSKYKLCGGGFFSPVPVISSLPVPSEAYEEVLAAGGKAAVEAFGGGGWCVKAPLDERLAVFSVGLRVRKSAGVVGGNKISVCLDGGIWRAQLPPPQRDVAVFLGASNTQDPAAAALYLAPSEASKIAISRAPPSVWAQYHTPYRSIEDKERALQYTKPTTTNY